MESDKIEQNYLDLKSTSPGLSYGIKICVQFQSNAYLLCIKTCSIDFCVNFSTMYNNADDMAGYLAPNVWWEFIGIPNGVQHTQIH